MNKNLITLIVSFLIILLVGFIDKSTSYDTSNFGDTVVFIHNIKMMKHFGPQVQY